MTARERAGLVVMSVLDLLMTGAPGFRHARCPAV
jgi:hypothetical protein